MKNLIFILIYLLCLSTHCQNMLSNLDKLRQQQINESRFNPNPFLTNFRIINSNKDRIYFDSSIEITASNASGFVVNGKTVNSITVNTNSTLGHYITLSTPFTFWDNPTIEYTGGNNILSGNNVELQPFFLKYIDNYIEEPHVENQVFYVSNSGSDYNDGLSKQTAFKTLEKAIRSFISGGGNIVYVENGTYTGESLRRQESTIYSGTATAPNKIIGYNDTPNVSFINYINNLTKNDNLTNIMPVFDGVNRSEGDNALIHTKGADYYIVKNIQLTNYWKAFDTWTNAKYWHFYNIVGKTNGSASSNSGGLFYFNADGCDFHRYKNIKSIDATGDHITLKGNNNAIIRCTAISTFANSSGDTQSTSDYYYQISGSRNIIYQSKAIKDTPNGWGHNGHGFTLKASNKTTEYNLIQGCEAVNLFGAYEFRHPETKYNYAISCVSRADIPNRTNSSSKQGSAGVSFLMGASNNTVDSFRAKEVDAAIVFGDNSEETVNTGADNNKVINSIFEDIDSYFLTYNANSSQATHINNIIEHCTFYNANRIYNNLSSNPISFTGCELKNSVIYDIPTNNLPNGWQFTYNNYWNHWLANGTPSANTGNISFDPQFNISKQITNKALKAGIDGTVKVDFNGYKRSSPPTMGHTEIIN